MSSQEKNILLRSFIKLLFLIGVIIVVGLLGKLVAYFNEGAEEVEIFNQLTDEKSIHTPEYKWKLQNKGVDLDPYTQEAIQLAYSNAWYFFNGALLGKSDTGLKDYFAKNLLKEIDAQISNQGEFTIEQVDLSHKIETSLFSFDRQLITFNDQIRLKRKIISKDESILAEQDHLHSYAVVMILEDGYWRIKELVKTNETKYQSLFEHAQVNSLPESINGINYYPSRNPWSDFWKHFAVDTTLRDFGNVKALGLNTVRIFIPYEGFGGPYVQDSSLAKLEKLLKVASQMEIAVIPTLFDFPPGYSYKNYPSTIKHAQRIFQKFGSHDAIVAWDIKNEADLDFDNSGQEEVLEWLELIIECAKKQQVKQPLTVGWSDAQYAPLLKDKLDFVSFHYFKSANDLSQVVRNLKSEVSDKEIVVSEFGKTSYSSAYIPFGSTVYQQASYAQEVNMILKENDIAHRCYWTLSDYSQIPSGVFGIKPWIKKSQKHFGVFDINGNPKLVAQAFISPEKKISRPFLDHITPFIISLLFFLLILLILIAVFSKTNIPLGRIFSKKKAA